MDRMEEILEIVREIREDVSFMKRHRNMLCGMLTEHFYRRKLRKTLSRIPQFTVR